MNRHRRADVVFMVAIVLALAVGLLWPSTQRWMFLVVCPATVYWASARGIGGALRGDGSLSARAERKTAEYLADQRKSDLSDH